MSSESVSRYAVALSGSFRRCYDEIRTKIREFEDLGFRVLSPQHSRPVNPGEEFVILESDESDDPATIEKRHLEAISEADALYLVNPGGYVGLAASMELGWAYRSGKLLFAQEECQDVTLSCFVRTGASPRDVLAQLTERHKNYYDTISRYSSLAELQKYVREVVRRRGFEDESSRDIVLLMVEELGELAKAIRKRVGLKVDREKGSGCGEAEQEIADVFIYLLDLANSCNVDLFSAFYNKERVNEKRKWSAEG